MVKLRPGLTNPCRLLTDPDPRAVYDEGPMGLAAAPDFNATSLRDRVTKFI